MSSSKSSMHRRRSSGGKVKPPALVSTASSGSGIQVEDLPEEEELDHHDHNEDHDHHHHEHSHPHSSHSHSHSHSLHHANEQDNLDILGPSPRSPPLPLPPTTPTNGYFLASPKPPGSPYIPLYSPGPPASPPGREDLYLGEDEVGNTSESLDDLPPLPQSASAKSTSFASSAAAAAEKKKHERIHSRNLSVFFPRPGQGGGDEERGGAGAGEDYDEAPVTEIGFGGRNGMGGQQGRVNGGFKFGDATAAGMSGPSRSNGGTGELEGAGGAKVSGRRGHHHKHSLSHNFFSFMDPGQTNPALSASQTDPFLSSDRDGNDGWSPSSPFSPSDTAFPTSSSDFPQSVQNDGSLLASQLPPSLSTRPTTLLGTLLSSSDYVKSMVLFGVLEFALGASLWVDGQAGGSVSVTGLGYLVVFDALGVLGLVGGKVMERSRGVASSYRYPFGNHRMESLILFAQAIFLLFSSVYICKESIEHVLLLGHDHDDDFFEMILPTTLLAVAFAASLFSALVYKNHSKLVEAVGTEIMGPDHLSSQYRSYLTNDVVVRVFSLIHNPFSLVVLTCTGALLFGGIFLDQDSFSNLDKLVAILETVLTFKISYPASVAFGRVLLQTAPPERAVQMISLTKALREVESHPLVVYLAPPHVWRILHHQASTVLPPPSKSLQPDFGGRGVRPQSPSSLLNAANAAQASSSCLLVVTLVVHVRQDASDQNLLDVTKYVYDRCAGAVGVSRRGRGGYTGDNGGEGELTVEVKRGAPSFSMDH